MAKNSRDYAAEYNRRIQRGLSKGFSKSRARGHALAGEDRQKAKAPTLPRGPEVSGLKMMKRGLSLTDAAHFNRISPERLRRYVLENTEAKYEKRSWIIKDLRDFKFPFYSRGRVVEPWLSAEAAERAGRYMSYVGPALAHGAPSFLKEFRGESVTDLKGRHHPFETDLNALYMLDAAGELSIPETYKIQGAAER